MWKTWESPNRSEIGLRQHLTRTFDKMEKLKLIVLLLAASTFVVVKSDKSEEKAKDAWKKKDVRDFK